MHFAFTLKFPNQSHSYCFLFNMQIRSFDDESDDESEEDLRHIEVKINQHD